MAELKYLQDMTIEDYNKVIGDDGTDDCKNTHIKSFKSLFGFMTHIGYMGHFKSYPIAKQLGYDVEFTLPIKK